MTLKIKCKFTATEEITEDEGGPSGQVAEGLAQDSGYQNAHLEQRL